MGRAAVFSTTVEYALRAIVFLATKPGENRSSQAVAGAMKVPSRYISKILKELVEAGLVQSQRGPNGGFQLARPADSISVLDVVNAVDPMKRITACPLKLPQHATRLCRLHEKLDDTMRLVEDGLRAAKIADMTDIVDATSAPVGLTVSVTRPR